jgi:hypothetical protein
VVGGGTAVAFLCCGVDQVGLAGVAALAQFTAGRPIHEDLILLFTAASPASIGVCVLAAFADADNAVVTRAHAIMDIVELTDGVEIFEFILAQPIAVFLADGWSRNCELSCEPGEQNNRCGKNHVSRKGKRELVQANVISKTGSFVGVRGSRGRIKSDSQLVQ